MTRELDLYNARLRMYERRDIRTVGWLDPISFGEIDARMEVCLL